MQLDSIRGEMELIAHVCLYTYGETEREVRGGQTANGSYGTASYFTS